VPTLITHPAVSLAFWPAVRRWGLPRQVLVVGAILTVIPDCDVLAFTFGIPYGDILGHRGFLHSIAFALLVTALATTAFVRSRRASKQFKAAVFGYLSVCAVSHGLLDALTNGGLGIALLSPFTDARYFFPVQPIQVSPIDLSYFLAGPAVSVLKSELLYVWMPCAAVWAVLRVCCADRRAAQQSHCA
jgi:inner membrane protein